MPPFLTDMKLVRTRSLEPVYSGAEFSGTGNVRRYQWWTWICQGKQRLASLKNMTIENASWSRRLQIPVPPRFSKGFYANRRPQMSQIGDTTMAISGNDRGNAGRKSRQIYNTGWSVTSMISPTAIRLEITANLIALKKIVVCRNFCDTWAARISEPNGSVHGNFQPHHYLRCSWQHSKNGKERQYQQDQKRDDQMSLWPPPC